MLFQIFNYPVFRWRSLACVIMVGREDIRLRERWMNDRVFTALFG